VLGQIIFFFVLLIIFGFITPAITRLKNKRNQITGHFAGHRLFVVGWRGYFYRFGFGFDAGFVRIVRKEKSLARVETLRPDYSYSIRAAIFCVLLKLVRKMVEHT
jgi:hypothetical protein